MKIARRLVATVALVVLITGVSAAFADMTSGPQKLSGITVGQKVFAFDNQSQPFAVTWDTWQDVPGASATVNTPNGGLVEASGTVSVTCPMTGLPPYVGPTPVRYTLDGQTSVWHGPVLPGLAGPVTAGQHKVTMQVNVNSFPPNTGAGVGSTDCSLDSYQLTVDTLAPSPNAQA